MNSTATRPADREAQNHESVHSCQVQMAIEEAREDSPSQQVIPGKAMLRNIWYFAVPSNKIRPGKMVQKKIMGELILIGRDSAGNVFAMRDICPHQGIPLTDGNFDGKEVECIFHGWKFGTDGVCTEIPALLPGQDLNLCSIRLRSYPCREVQGTVWIYMGKLTDTLPEIPKAAGLDGYRVGQTTVTLHLSNHIDYNAVALIDTAHVPYVHNAWWWRSARNPKEKTKTYVPTDNGWTMVKHSPSKHSVFKFIGDATETEIGFRLPGCRIEHILFKGRVIISGISTLTPIDENNTELNHTTYWTLPSFNFVIKPIIDYFVTSFLKQDAVIAAKQKVGLATKPHLIYTIPDTGTPGRWYLDLKREWAQAYAEGRPFVNPIKKSILRWRT